MNDRTSTLIRRERWKNRIRAVFILGIIVVAISFVRYRNSDVNYLNSDATWHTLLTMECYDETPVSVHHFLPIVSLGGDENKGILWGETVPDQYGNYYYTSFSPAGYVLPYFFVKVFHLPIQESSLYIFNCVLLFLSALFWLYLVNEVYKGSKQKRFIEVIAVAVYLFSPEILHGMGIVYWHQSLMQVMLLIQLCAWYKSDKSCMAKILFWSMCVVNPYVEWTGYVANMGFALAAVTKTWKKSKKRAMYDGIVIAGLSILSFVLFFLHYLTVVEKDVFFQTIINRFFARSFATSDISLMNLLQGYGRSFFFLWVLFLFLFLWVCIQEKGISWIKRGMLWENKLLLFVLVFPAFENMIMKQHAVSYTYDRMKLIIPLGFIICDIAYVILQKADKKWKLSLLGFGVMAACLVNMHLYMNDTSYVWAAPYKNTNRKLANYILDNYEDSTIVSENFVVRGYTNLLFHRGIYEFGNMDDAIAIAKEKGNQFAIVLKSADNGAWGMKELSGASVYNNDTGITTELLIEDGSIVISES